jgi:lipopolysaccharide/colanic/teichoic acid biosynthesis glycosyltransferase
MAITITAQGTEPLPTGDYRVELVAIELSVNCHKILYKPLYNRPFSLAYSSICSQISSIIASIVSDCSSGSAIWWIHRRISSMQSSTNCTKSFTSLRCRSERSSGASMFVLQRVITLIGRNLAELTPYYIHYEATALFTNPQ